MKTITFHCETITPMFLAGADGKTPELRPPSIKGALRFWWRAMNGHLSLAELKEKEGLIFGGGGENGGRSKIILSLKESQPVNKNTITAHPTPHKSRPFSKEAIKIGFKFNIQIGVVENQHITISECENLFILFSVLGGLGNRSRRGFGSFKITKIDNTNFNPIQKSEEIKKLINSRTSKLENEKEKYPYYIKHQIGNTLFNDITRHIGETTNKFHKKYGNKYDNAMGKAMGGRMASPIYVSVIEKEDGKLYPIITTLNTALKNDASFEESIQEEFINNIL